MKSWLRDEDFVRYLKSSKKNRRILTQYRFLVDQIENVDRSMISLRSRKFKRYAGVQLTLQTRDRIDYLWKLLAEEREVLGDVLTELEQRWLRHQRGMFEARKRSEKGPDRCCQIPKTSGSQSSANQSWWHCFFSNFASVFRQEQRQKPDQTKHLSTSATNGSMCDCIKPDDPEHFSKLLQEKLELVQRLRQDLRTGDGYD